MKINRWALVCVALLVSVGLSTPSSAQGLAAQSAKIAELGRAGKYAEAIPLAQAMVASLEKGPPTSRDLAGALNNLAELLATWAGMPMPSPCTSAQSQSWRKW